MEDRSVISHPYLFCSDLFTQQLASRLVIDGITPPSWLLSPNYNSRSSYLNGKHPNLRV
ncbi:hypothetical protein Hanom_Chr05g00397941 [Helianthus anomalus]